MHITVDTGTRTRAKTRTIISMINIITEYVTALEVSTARFLKLNASSSTSPVTFLSTAADMNS